MPVDVFYVYPVKQIDSGLEICYSENKNIRRKNEEETYNTDSGNA